MESLRGSGGQSGLRAEGLSERERGMRLVLSWLLKVPFVIYRSLVLCTSRDLYERRGASMHIEGSEYAYRSSGLVTKPAGPRPSHLSGPCVAPSRGLAPPALRLVRSQLSSGTPSAILTTGVFGLRLVVVGLCT